MVDGLHAIESVGTDLFLTGDTRLAEAMAAARALVGNPVPVAVAVPSPLLRIENLAATLEVAAA
jgi:hypothetical protein